MEEERDSVVFEDDEGNEIELDIIDYFFHNEQEYAVLMDLSNVPEEHEHENGEDCDCAGEAQDIYIMKIVVNGDTEEFLPVDDEMMDELSEIVERRLFAEDEEEEEEESKE